MYKRVLIKLSGEALAGEKGIGFDYDNALRVAKQVKSVLDKDIQVGIVVGAGNIWRGKNGKNMDPTKAHQIGIVSTVVNSMYMAEVFKTVGIDSIVQSSITIGAITEVFSKESAIQYLNNKKVVFFAGGIGHPFFSTDTAAVLRAIETDMEALLLAKNIDGVYESDPKINKNAKKYENLTYTEIIDNNLKVMDLTAASLAMENNLSMLVFGLNEENSIEKAVLGEKIGTRIENRRV